VEVIRLTPSGNGKTAAGHRRAPDVSLLIVVVVYCEKNKITLLFGGWGNLPLSRDQPLLPNTKLFLENKNKKVIGFVSGGSDHGFAWCVESS